MAGLTFRVVGLLHLILLLAVSGCNYGGNRGLARPAPGQAPGKAPGDRGIYHIVSKGETLYRIGKAYGIDHAALARINKVANVRKIRIGNRLFIPGATRRLPVRIITPVKKRKAPPTRTASGKTAAGKAQTSRRKTAAGKAARAPAAARKARVTRSQVRRSPPAKRSKSGFAWPVKGKVTARFDSRPDSLNDGIDIAAPAGTPVRATAAGQVIYSDHLRGYGNVIIVRHRGGFASVYAHNRRNLVRPGQRVRRQQVIAEVGNTGRVTRPHLHFEIRRNNIARNPLSYLP